MSHLIFILLLVLATIIRTPLALVLIVLKSVIHPLNKRFVFERKNFIDPECRSFKKDQLVADYCFEVSSEGELEQVRPLMEFFLSEKKRLEILFSSPSVESKCLKMAQEHKDYLRVLRLPLVTHFFLFQTAHRWMSASKLIFCRYDFFPELLLLKFFQKKMILLSAATKNPSWFKKEVYHLFDLIVAANKKECRTFANLYRHDLNKLIFDFDFRIPRIFKRIENASETLKNRPQLEDYLRFLNGPSHSLKVIMGSAWISDFGVLKNTEFLGSLKKGESHLLIVPHDLKAKSIEEMQLFLKNLLGDIPLYEISQSINSFNPKIPGVVFLNMSGVLCELYTQFKSVYVGGGYARSIHSVLEPYLCGAHVYCGPKIHRSTEYDFVQEVSPEEIHLLNNPESFYNLLKQNAALVPNQSTRESIKIEAQVKMKTIIQEITAC